MSKRRPKKPSLFDNMCVSHALTKVMKIKLLNKPEDYMWNEKL